MKTISLKVTQEQDRLITEAVRRKGMPSKSEFVRHAVLRSLEDELSLETIEEIFRARQQIRAGRTVSLEKLTRGR